MFADIESVFCVTYIQFTFDNSYCDPKIEMGVYNDNIIYPKAGQVNHFCK